MRDAIARKAREGVAEKERFFDANAGAIEACARAMAAAFEAGGKLFTFGNGGSACDAEHAAVEFLHPIVEKRRALPAIALGTSSALVTAIGNDTDFSQAFTDPLRLLGRSGDIALGITTSGRSPNVLYALKAARALGMVTVGLGGRDGGGLPDAATHCFVVPSFSIHRIQEVHVMFLHILWDLVHVALGEEDVL